MFLPMIVAVLAGLPAAYELDYRALPLANTMPYYEYTIIMSWPGEPDVKVPTGIGTKCTAAEAAKDFFDSLNDPSWKVKKDGLCITIYGYDDVRIKNLTIEGKGPKPQVRRVFVLPPEKKK